MRVGSPFGLISSRANPPEHVTSFLFHIKMRRIATLMAALAITTTLSAQSMSTVFSEMPESLVPYVGTQQKQEMMNLLSLNKKGQADNLLQEKSRIDTLTADFMQLTLNDAAMLQIKRLPYQGTDSILCVVKTWRGPQPESRITFYRKDWSAVVEPATTQLQHTLSVLSAPKMSVGLTSHQTDSLRDAVDFTLVSSTLSPSNSDMIITCQVPLAPKEQKDRLAMVYQPVTLRWNGSTYVEE